MKTPDGVEIAERYLGTWNQAIQGESGPLGMGASTILILIEDLSRAEYERDLLNGALTAKNQTVAEQERSIEDLESLVTAHVEQKAALNQDLQRFKAENARLREALEMIYDKWEDGVSCYEDPEEHAGFVGNALQLSDEEEKQILTLIPKRRTAALNPTKEASNG